METRSKTQNLTLIFNAPVRKLQMEYGSWFCWSSSRLLLQSSWCTRAWPLASLPSSAMRPAAWQMWWTSWHRIRTWELWCATSLGPTVRWSSSLTWLKICGLVIIRTVTCSYWPSSVFVFVFKQVKCRKKPAFPCTVCFCATIWMEPGTRKAVQVRSPTTWSPSLRMQEVQCLLEHLSTVYSSMMLKRLLVTLKTSSHFPTLYTSYRLEETSTHVQGFNDWTVLLALMQVWVFWRGRRRCMFTLP